MIKSTPIKRHPSLASFSRDHHFGLLLVWKIRQGLTKGVNITRIANYVLYGFDNDLRLHFKDEEELMFSRLPELDPLRRQAENEHAAIYALVEALRSELTNHQSLTKFAQLLQEHIRFEERILFPHMEKIFSKADLDIIAGYDGNAPGEVDAGWKDQFWQ